MQKIDESWQESLFELNSKCKDFKRMWNFFFKKIAIRETISLIIKAFLKLLVFIFVVIIIGFMVSFIFVAIGWFSGELGISRITENWTLVIPWTNLAFPLGPSLNYRVSEQELFFMVEIVAATLIGILLMGILKEEGETIILPFEVVVTNKAIDKIINGNTIAEMLMGELIRIKKIHTNSVNIRSGGNLPQIELPTVQIPLKGISPKGENIDQFVESLGTFDLGSTSLPLGSLLVLIRRLCPFTDPGNSITGYLLIQGSDIRLSARMKWKEDLWSLHKEFRGTRELSYQELSDMIQELSFKIIFGLMEKKMREREINTSVSSLKSNDKNSGPSNWIVLKQYTEAMERLDNYNKSRESKEIECAKKCLLNAISIDPYYNSPLYLLYNGVGIAYLNEEKYPEAESLARYAVTLRPDSSLVLYSWGLALLQLRLYEEAAECLDLGLTHIDPEKKYKIESELHALKAIALRGLMRYDEAIELFNRAIIGMYQSGGTKRNLGYIWGHYGITLEAKAEQQENEAKKAYENEAEKAYENAKNYNPDFISARLSLVRTYKKRTYLTDEEKRNIIERECKNARRSQAFEDLKDYNRACIYIICGDQNSAKYFLEKAIDKGRIEYEWLMNDKDWESVTNKNVKWFEDLVTKLKEKHKDEKKKDIKNLIMRAAIRKKLNDMNRMEPSLFYKYDLRDPNGFIIKLKYAIISKYFFNNFSEQTRKYLNEYNYNSTTQRSGELKKILLSELDELLKKKGTLVEINKFLSENNIQIMNSMILTLVLSHEINKTTNAIRSGTPLLDREDIVDPKSLVNKLKSTQCGIIFHKFSPDAIELIKKYDGISRPSMEMQNTVLAELNKIINSKLNDLIKILNILNNDEIYYLNRSILALVYPEIVPPNKISKPKSMICIYDINDVNGLVNKLKASQNKVAKHILSKIPKELTNKLLNHDSSVVPSMELRDNLIHELNKLLDDKDLYKESMENGRQANQVEQKLQEMELQNLNRKILAKAFPDEIKSDRTLPEIKEKILEEIEFKPSYVQARFYAVFGETNKAIESLKKAVLKERIDVETIKFEPDFENIRDDPQFIDVIREEVNKKRCPK